MKIYWKKLSQSAVIPKRATKYSAGFDLCADIKEPVTIKAGEIKLIGTGLAVQPSDMNVALMIYARSGLASKYGITLANSVGVVDSDYRGEIKVALINLSDKDFIIEPCMRIAQLVVTPVELAESEEKTELDETKRGDGGFGSTGK
jgi:dUTP pyrophosphatase